MFSTKISDIPDKKWSIYTGIQLRFTLNLKVTGGIEVGVWAAKPREAMTVSKAKGGAQRIPVDSLVTGFWSRSDWTQSFHWVFQWERRDIKSDFHLSHDHSGKSKWPCCLLAYFLFLSVWCSDSKQYLWKSGPGVEKQTHGPCLLSW